MIHDERIRVMRREPRADSGGGRYVLYWMQAAQRVRGNHALTFAVRRANELGLPVVVCFGLTAGFPEANRRHYTFMLQGLLEVRRELAGRGIRFVILCRPPAQAALELATGAAMIVTDRGYLRIQKEWRDIVARAAPCPVIQVETEVVVPVAVVSPKEEYAAATLRRKITPCLETYLHPLVETEVEKSSLEMDLDLAAAPDQGRGDDDPNRWQRFPRGADNLRPEVISPGRGYGRGHNSGYDPGGRTGEDIEIAGLLAALDIARTVPPVTQLRGGESEAHRLLNSFIATRLKNYREAHNDPAGAGASHLSPYLHFGQISPLTVALQVLKQQGIPQEEKEAFLEELIVRRELSMNFVHYHPAYDHYEALPAWAVKSLASHAGDERPYRYAPEELECARTHDPYWNAAQQEMVFTGKMNNYMRMYWGKKILEWSATPREAFHVALYLNNKYALDGRDPNSFAGVAWCFGKHDRPWGERKIFGQIRYMNEAGLRRKFNMKEYVRKIEKAIREEGTGRRQCA